MPTPQFHLLSSPHRTSSGWCWPRKTNWPRKTRTSTTSKSTSTTSSCGSSHARQNCCKTPSSQTIRPTVHRTARPSTTWTTEIHNNLWWTTNSQCPSLARPPKKTTIRSNCRSRHETKASNERWRLICLGLRVPSADKIFVCDQSKWGCYWINFRHFEGLVQYCSNSSA